MARPDKSLAPRSRALNQDIDITESNAEPYMQLVTKSCTEEKLTILFFGLGSIGSRLARLIGEKFPHRIFALRGSGHRHNELGIEEIYDKRDIKKLSPDIAFITNPTSLHMETAIESASRGMHLFIEKPLSHGLEGWDTLLKMTRGKKLFTYVACNLRFDPIIQQLKKTIDPDHFFYSRVICSSYLPDWRPGRSYKELYSSKKNLGGGVILDLIHEPDYCYYLFGPINRITGHAGNLSSLEIESEDYADITLHHASGFVSNIHLDYFGKRKQRRIELYGKDIYLEADLIERNIITSTGNGVGIENVTPLSTDYTYEEELKYFFGCLQKKSPPMNSIEEHMTVLRPLLQFKKELGL